VAKNPVREMARTDLQKRFSPRKGKVEQVRVGNHGSCFPRAGQGREIGIICTGELRSGEEKGEEATINSH